jgi:hypothetical protein
MNATHVENFQELRRRFEGREAIYVDRGAWHVRVSDIRLQPRFHVAAEIERFPTPGLDVPVFHTPAGPVPPVRWNTWGGYLTSFTENSWSCGYGGWSLYFSPKFVQMAIEGAAPLADNPVSSDIYKRICQLVMEPQFRHTWHRYVFRDVVERGTGMFRLSGELPVAVQMVFGWVTCPWCDMRFKPTDPLRWDGHRHTSCGQRLLIEVAEDLAGSG